MATGWAFPLFSKAFAPHFPAKIDVDDRPADNPNNASLPALTGDLASEELAALPDNVLVVSYGQTDTTSGMFMTIEHNLNGKLKLDAAMMIIKPNAYEKHYTSTCPIESEMMGMEMWPHPIGPMLLSNFRLLKPTDDQGCK